ncbi:MAG: hypothetical protein R3F34_19835 [Planctomycetota bacterium]
MARPRPLAYLVHWNEAETPERLAKLEAAGYRARGGPVGPAELRALRADPPDVLVVDLTRLPSHGRDVAMAWRTSKATRHVPIAFLEGEPAKVERVRAALPDAEYGTWRAVKGTLAKALTRRGEAVLVPKDVLAGYSGTPLPKKLGVKEGALVRLLDAPKDAESILGELPAGVRTSRRATVDAPDVVLWFVTKASKLRSGMAAARRSTGDGLLWICWPKKASGVATDVSEPLVREIGLASGMVDSKIAAIDAVWSGLRFTERRKR